MCEDATFFGLIRSPCVGHVGVFQNDTVNQGGQYLGRDPDPNVRSEILKDDSEYNGNGY